MHFLISLVILAATATDVALVAAKVLRVQYYTDGGCTEYLTSIEPIQSSCYQYQYTGANSANIVQQDGSGNQNPLCYFFSGPDCTGSWESVENDACASNYGVGWQSMDCYYVSHRGNSTELEELD
jgi:hypothetical protein